MVDQLGFLPGVIVAALLVAGTGPGACERAGGPGPTSPEPVRVADGAWGSIDARLEVDGATVSIEFGCAHGTLEGPLTLDERHQFSVNGTFVRERPGPIREGDESSAQKAVYSGRVDGDRLTLDVKAGEEDLGTFTLVQGQARPLRKCL